MFELVEVTSNKSSYERYIDQNLVFSFSRPATMEIWSVHGMISHCSLQKTQQTRYFSTSTNVHLLLQTFNMVVEIPRFSQAKFEINREWPLNPIRQDVTSVITGNEQRWTYLVLEHMPTHIRFLPNVFPWHGHICNYGALPQTWESPYHQVGKFCNWRNEKAKFRTNGRER